MASEVSLVRGTCQARTGTYFSRFASETDNTACHPENPHKTDVQIRRRKGTK